MGPVLVGPLQEAAHFPWLLAHRPSLCSCPCLASTSLPPWGSSQEPLLTTPAMPLLLNKVMHSRAQGSGRDISVPCVGRVAGSGPQGETTMT